jgi:hypothetical protein
MGVYYDGDGDGDGDPCYDSFIRHSFFVFQGFNHLHVTIHYEHQFFDCFLRWSVKHPIKLFTTKIFLMVVRQAHRQKKNDLERELNKNTCIIIDVFLEDTVGNCRHTLAAHRS